VKAGLLLLSGGAGQRMGARKHALEHPAGGSWGGHLVRVFETVFPEGPIQVLGEPLPDSPELLSAGLDGKLFVFNEDMPQGVQQHQ